jgi:hypothetical protein
MGPKTATPKGKDLMTNSVRLALVLVLMFVSAAQAKRTHMLFFEGTDHELNVYRVYGKEDGNTILLIGGIQGDEPGGFLSADFYADMSLSRGNLIVVPRANFHSILLNQRQVNEDMNRKFDENTAPNFEAKVVAILKGLIAESDCLLNLHDGSGFFSKDWVDDDRNPKRFGQSIIADCEHREINGQAIELGDVGRRVVDKINQNIKNKDHYFHFNNHNTFSEQSIHKVQRKSATYYALTKCGIPAFGIESSKSLPLEQKVRHHILAINAFMEEYGVIPDIPAVNLEKPELKYLVISVNNTLPIVVRHEQILSIRPNDTVTITHIETNFERGLSADILGFGSINDFRKPLVITRATRIVARKDYDPCGSVYLALDENSGTAGDCLAVRDLKRNGGSFLMYRIKVNGQIRLKENYGTIKLVQGDVLEIEDVVSDAYDPSELRVNFKGFVAESSVNTGEDRGCRIDTGKDLWPAYSLNGRGLKYQVVTQAEHVIIGKLFVELVKPSLKYLLIKTDDRSITCYENEASIMLDEAAPGGVTLDVVDLVSNLDVRSDVTLRMLCPEARTKPLTFNSPFVISPNTKNDPLSLGPCRIEVLRDSLPMGSVSIQYTQEMNQDEQIEKPVNH